MQLYYIDGLYKGYDTYDSMVIAAASAEDAYHLACAEAAAYTDTYYPSFCKSTTPVWRNYYLSTYGQSMPSFAEANIRCIALDTDEPEGVICASFNAG